MLVRVSFAELTVYVAGWGRNIRPAGKGIPVCGIFTTKPGKIARLLESPLTIKVSEISTSKRRAMHKRSSPDCTVYDTGRMRSVKGGAGQSGGGVACAIAAWVGFSPG